MPNELTKQNTGTLAAAISEHELGEMLKPLIREIFLFDSYVAGTTELADQEVLKEIRVGDKLKLQREDSKFDSNAILLFTEDGKRVGYVPEKDNVVFARLMDAGKLLTARVAKTEMKGSFHRIAIGIYLVDF